MKKFLRYACALFLVFCLVPVSPVSATSFRASYQISQFLINVFPVGDGRLEISAAVYATGRMTELGMDRIEIYRSIQGEWVEVKTYERDDSGMTATNTSSFSDSIFYNGISGSNYRVVVTIFAKDSSGEDARTQSFYVTA